IASSDAMRVRGTLHDLSPVGRISWGTPPQPSPEGAHRRCGNRLPHIHGALRELYACSSSGLLIIQGMPNWSVPMPNPLEKKVLLNGMLMLPPSHSAWNLRSASCGSDTVNETENPCGL